MEHDWKGAAEYFHAWADHQEDLQAFEMCSLVARVASALANKTLVLCKGHPHAWMIPGADNANPKGWMDARCFQDGEFSMPVYAAAPDLPEGAT